MKEQLLGARILSGRRRLISTRFTYHWRIQTYNCQTQRTACLIHFNFTGMPLSLRRQTFPKENYLLLTMFIVQSKN